MTLRWLVCIIVIFYSLFSATHAMAQQRVELAHTTASLVSEYHTIDGTQPVWLLFQLDIQPSWHTYWLNPGDSGMAPTLKWILPRGISAGEILWQPPQRQPFGPLMNYGYSDVAYHLVQLHIADGAYLPETLPIELDARWLVCEEECIPERATLHLTLYKANDAIPGEQAPRIRRLVQTANHPELPLSNLHVRDDEVRFSVPAPANHSEVQSVYFYAEASGFIVPAAPQSWSIADGWLHVRAARGLAAAPAQLRGLLEVQGQGDDRQFYTLIQTSNTTAETTRNITGNTKSALAAPALSAPVAAPAVPLQQALWLVILSAFLGGVILNAMPCVFPVLSFKALAIAKKADKHSTHIRQQGLAYTAGVVLSFAAIGALLLMLKTGGTAIGWGFQMQSPLFVAALVYVLFLVGLNLSGVFELRVSFSGGQGVAARQDWLGSFATGVLATVVATPCTAPFMATALGVALTLPAAHAMLVFVALGLGLAAPFLLLSFWPALLRLLPKPGAWMERFRQFLAFPMYLSAIWLLWVAGRQLGVDAVALVLTGLVAVTFGIWLWQHPPRNRMLRAILFIAVAAAVIMPFVALRNAMPPSFPARASNAAPYTQEFSASRLAAYREEGKKVFVYGTADWCIICKMNEQVALNTDAIRTYFTENDIVVLRADWTYSDPEITAYLAQYNRSGVPIYVYYPRQGEAVILPQLLTPDIIREHTS